MKIEHLRATSNGETVPQIQLSLRERQLLTCLIQGRTNKEIAAQMGITPGTVKQYCHSLYTGLRVYGRVRLAVWAYKHPEALEGAGVDVPATAPRAA